ncbi:zinc-binding alcohol dehydrogenase family protein [Patulibacter sp. NPDC049589]|uniref:quinone oxidoreductase family protein n=1 Tax=Patulibacter sp. NPDC049589 TaxID=3154731 RepID=UPI003418EDAD
MRAVRFARPAPDASVTSVEDLPAPTPGPGAVAIAVTAAGVNFLDVMARRGDPGYVAAWPFVPGLEVSGRITAVGPGVDPDRVGRRVAAFTGRGGLAEVAVAADVLAVEVPDALSPERAAVAPGAVATAVLLVGQAARVGAGDVVLVHSAAGGVGRAVAAVARARGAITVLGVAGDRRRRDAARGAGFDEVFVRGPGLARDVREHLGGGGVDAILDTRGTGALDEDLALAAPGARIVLFGNASGAALGPLPPAGRLFAGNVSIGGFSVSSLAAVAPQRLGTALGTALDLLADGTVELEPEVHDGLAAVGGLHDAFAAGTAAAKAVVRP